MTSLNKGLKKVCEVAAVTASPWTRFEWLATSCQFNGHSILQSHDCHLWWAFPQVFLQSKPMGKLAGGGCKLFRLMPFFHLPTLHSTNLQHLPIHALKHRPHGTCTPFCSHPFILYSSYPRHSPHDICLPTCSFCLPACLPGTVQTSTITWGLL